MERMAKKIANKISLELDLDNDKRDVIAYGTFSLLQITISIIIVIIIGAFFNVIIEALIIQFAAAILRKYSGGVHANSPSTCVIIGTLVSIGGAICGSVFLKFSSNVAVIASLGVITFIFSYILINKFAPVDNVKKPIKKEQKRKRMKKNSLKVLSIYLTIVIMCVISYKNFGWVNLLNYSLCLYIGIIWQSFTLTKLGHLTVNKLDYIFSFILF